MFVLAYLGVVAGIVRRASRIRVASFDDGVWWQRVETISFASLPQNLIVLVPAAVAAVVGTIMVRPVVDQSVIWLRQLVRATAGTCYVVIVIAALGILGLLFRSGDNVGDVEQMLSRLGGAAMAYGMIRLCLEAERTS